MSMNAVDTATTLELARGETVACVSSVEPGTGHTRYKVKGKRIEGVVTVIPAYDRDLANPFTKRVALQLGDCADGHAHVRGRDRSHLLTVNTIELMGTGITDITHVPAADPYNVLPYDMGVGYLSRRGGVEIPDATRFRVAALFGMIIDHWRNDPGNHTVRLAAARHAVRTGDYLKHKAATIRNTRERIAELQAELDRHEIDYKRMQLLRDSTDPDAADPDQEDPDQAGPDSAGPDSAA